MSRIPLYVRAGTILPEIPDDIMTLVPCGQYSDTKVKCLDDRRIYEIYPGKLRSITDFEGRKIGSGTEGDIGISGKPAEVTLRWRFQSPRSVTVNGKDASLERSQGVASVRFRHVKNTLIRVHW